MNITENIDNIIQYIVNFIEKMKGYVDNIIEFFSDLRERIEGLLEYIDEKLHSITDFVAELKQHHEAA
jgi:predicted PurR-regulated permease PerM